jgi:hypothetical protein
MADANAILSFQGKDNGLQKVLKSAADSFDGLADSVVQGKDNLSNLREESGLFEKAFKSASGSVNKGRDAFDKLGDSASAVGDGFSTSAKVTDITSKGFVKFAASALGVGKQVGFVNTVLGPMGDLWHDVDDAQTGVGKGFAVINAVSKPLITSLKSAAEFTANLSEQMGFLGESGKAVAGILLGVSQSLGGLAGGVKIADMAGDVYRLVEAVKEFTEESLPELIEQAKGAYEMFEKTGLKAALFGDTLKTLRTTATILQATTKGLTKELSGMFLGFLQFKETVGMIKGFYTALHDSYLQMKGLSEATSAFQAMGLDTTMASLAVKVGAFGEGLIANAEAAREFVNTTVAAFAQVQDKLGYLQTLSTAAAESQGTLFSSLQALTSGPLKNAVTMADAAGASYFAMSAGADSLAKSNLLMTATAKGSVAGQVDQAQAINAVTNAMAPYKINFRDADKVMGQFFATTEAGQLDLGNLTGAIGELSSSASSANIPLQQVLGMYATLTKVGPPGEAATRLSNLLQDITATGGEAQEELDRLGIRLDKYTIQQKGLLPLLQEIYTKTGGSVEKMRKIFANDYSFQAFQGLVSNMKDANKIIESVGSSGAETLDKMFDKRRETLMQQGTELMNGFKDVMADLGQRVLPLLEPGIKFLNQILENFQQMPEWQKNMIAGIAMGTIVMQKAGEVGGTFTGVLLNLGKTYLIARGMSLFWSRQLLNEGAIIKDLILKHQDYGGALLRLFGIQKEGASVATTILSAQEEATKAANLGKQAETLRTQATTAQEVAARSQAQAELLRSEAVKLSAQANVAATNATNLRSQADAAGGANAKLNADAQKAEAAAASLRATADEASADAVQAKAAAEVKAVEATKARASAETAAHNADLAQKNASIRASQAAAAAEAQAIKLENAALQTRSQATAATTSALELEAVATQKAAAATTAKAAADKAGGTNAVLSAKASVLQKEATLAQSAASDAATKAISLNAAASKAEIAATDAATAATAARTQAETAATAVTTKNTGAKVENAAVDLVDDAAAQSLGVVNGAVQANTVNVQANSAAKTAATASTASATTAEVTNTVATETNTGATLANTQARGFLGKINAFLTGQINLSNIAMTYNTSAMKASAGGMGIMSVATKLFAGGMGVARAAVTAFWTSLGPITLAIIGLYTAFNIFKEVGQMVGIIGSDFSDLADQTKKADQELIKFKASLIGAKEEAAEEPEKGWFKSALEYIGLTRDKTAEYTGFVNTTLLPFLNLAANAITAIFRAPIDTFKGFLNLVSGGKWGKAIDDFTKKGFDGAKNVLNKATGGVFEDALSRLEPNVNSFFKVLKDGFQNNLEAPMRKVFEEADRRTTDLLIKTQELKAALSKGELIGSEAKRLLAESRDRANALGQAALKGEDFQKILEANRRDIENRTKINDERVTQLTEQLNAKGVKSERKEQLQAQIDALKEESSELEEVGKKQERYLQNIQSIAQSVDENNASLSSDKTLENLRRQQAELTEGVSGPLKEAYDSVFDSLEKGMNNTGLVQRRVNNQLIQAVKNFEDNTKKPKNITSMEDLTKARQDADVLQQKILESAKTGGISKELAQTLFSQLKNQEIEVDTPDFKFKGKILTPEQEQTLIETETELNQGMVDWRTAQIQQGIEDINAAEAKGELLGGQAQVKRLTKQLEIDKERLDNAKETEQLMLDTYGEKSPQYVKAVQDRRAAERQIEKDSYDKQLTAENYYTERRVKLREQAMSRIKSLEDTQRLTTGQSQIQTLQEEQKIAGEQAAAIRKRMGRIKDTNSDAYKELQQQLEQIERDGDTKRFQEQKARQDYALDRRVKVHEDAIAQIDLAEKTLLKTQGQAQQESLRREIAIANERIKLSRQRLAQVAQASGTGSDVYKDQLREVQVLEREITVKRFQEERAQEDYALDRRVKLRQDAISKIQAAEQTLLKTQGQAQQESLREEINISNERVKLAKSRLEDLRNRAGEGSDVYKDQLLEVDALEREITVKRFQNQRAQEDYALDRRVKKHEEAMAEIKLSETLLQKTQFEASQALLKEEIATNDERINLARTRLEDLRDRAGESSDVFKDQERELRSLEREQVAKAFQLQTASVINELEVQQQRIANQVEAQTQAYRTQTNQLDLITAQLQTQQELTESRNSLIQTATSGIQQQMEAVGKLVSDELLSSQLQGVSAQARLRALEQSASVELKNLERQQEQKALALERQKIDLAGSKLANQRAIQDEIINFRKSQANQKLTAEQIEQHNLAISNLTQQSQLLEGQEQNLNNQIASQSELNANAQEEAQIRQQQAKDGGVMDVMLAKQSEMTAKLNKESDILQKQQAFMQSRLDSYTASLGILSSTTNSEKKQRDIAAAIAAIKLNSLNQQQEMERKVLEMQLRQKEAVLDQEKSRIRIMDAENKARIAEAKERVGLAIEEGKSTEQVNARIEALKGYLEAGAAIKSAGISVEERGKFEKQMGEFEKAQQAQQQMGQRQQGILDLAENLSIGRQRDLKEFLQGEILNQMGTSFDDLSAVGRSTASAVIAGGYDQRQAFTTAPALTPPKEVDYEAIRKDYMSQLSEFVIPDKTGTKPTTQTSKAVELVQQQVGAIQQTVDAIAKRQPNKLDQKNTFNIHLPVGSTADQAKSLEEPLIKLQMDLWKQVRQELDS